MGEAPAIDGEATPDRAEQADAETARPTYGTASRGEGIMTIGPRSQ
jgi:hypothetical protein